MNNILKIRNYKFIFLKKMFICLERASKKIFQKRDYYIVFKTSQKSNILKEYKQYI